MQCTLVCVVVVVGVCVSSGDAGRGAGGPRGQAESASQESDGSRQQREQPHHSDPRDYSALQREMEKMGWPGADSAGGQVQGLKGSRGAPAGVSRVAEGTLVAALPSPGLGLARHPPSAAEGPAPFTRLCPRTTPCSLPPQAVGEGFC